MKNVCILGATGSIGRASLEVIQHLKNEFRVVGVSCYSNSRLLLEIVEKFSPKYACIVNKGKRVKNTGKTKFLYGCEGLLELVSKSCVDIVLNAIEGSEGVFPTLTAIREKKQIAMANKESLVAYGKIIMEEVKKHHTKIIPVDSEHVAIHQCIQNRRKQVKKIILTASGGPFFKKPIPKEVKVEEVLNHPVWDMGNKITVDSATLMNKGLEVIEATVLFGVPVDNIEVVIHPQAVVHSGVEFKDNTVLFQLSYPDMRLPIQYSLCYPKKLPSLLPPLSLPTIKKLEFFPPSYKKFPLLKLAYRAGKIGGSMPCVLNKVNEIVVKEFINGRIKFKQIHKIIEKILSLHKVKKDPTLEELTEVEEWVKEETYKLLS